MIRTDTDFQLTGEGIWATGFEGFRYAMACEASKRGFLAPMFTEKRPRTTIGSSAPDPLDNVDTCD